MKEASGSEARISSPVFRDSSLYALLRFKPSATLFRTTGNTTENPVTPKPGEN